MSERARVLSWWGYVLVVVTIFEVTFQFANFAYAVAAALLAIAVLGSLLKLIVWRLTRPSDRAGSSRKPADRS